MTQDKMKIEKQLIDTQYENTILKNRINIGIQQKFNEKSELINKIDWNDPNGYILYAMLKKEFEFLEPFSTAMGGLNFNNSDENVTNNNGFIDNVIPTVNNLKVKLNNIDIKTYEENKIFVLKYFLNESIKFSPLFLILIAFNYNKIVMLFQFSITIFNFFLYFF